MNSLVSDRRPLVSMFFILLIVGSGFLLIGPGVGLAVASLFYDGNLLQAIQQNPDYTIFTPLMITQGFASLLGLIVFPLLYVIAIERKPWQPFINTPQPWTVTLPLLMVAGIAFQFALSPVVEWNMNFQFPEFMKSFGDWARAREDSLIQLTQLLTHFQSQTDFMIGLVVIAILPGIGEEIVFRGLIQNELKRGTGNAHLSIWLAAFLFSSIHMQFFGLIPRMLLGALFGYLYHWSGNLLVPMFAHFFHNGFTLVMLYLYQIGSSDLDMESTESAPVLWVMIGIISTFALLYFFRSLYPVKHEPDL